MTDHKRTTAHIISHTHWDREWYLPYEKHHVRLVKLMNTLLNVMESDPDYRYFHLDGQTIILEDFLQVHPERKEQLASLIRSGRIQIGPWYVLQDEFLTSSEANVRNLQIGHQDALAFGAVSKLGYFPDSFGNMGQAPQMLKQAGIDTAVFGRGVTPTGFNNTVQHEEEFKSPYSEMLWESKDGSQVLGILFANWYSNGNEIPTDRQQAMEYWDRKLADAKRFASTPHLLFMNGCDHQPIQTDLSSALQTARELYPAVDYVHSNFDDYIDEVKRALPDSLSVIRGELRSQRTDGWGTLVNTASSRIYLKQMNHLGQTLLEKAAEPTAAFAAMLGTPYPHHLFTYAWKTLMQNHPHDSICGCSIDEVHDEMVTRFRKSRHVAEAILEDSLKTIAEQVDTSLFEGMGEGATSFIVINSSGWARSGTVSIELDVKRVYFREGIEIEEMRRLVKNVSLGGLTLVAESGADVPFTLEDQGTGFGYDLPDDRFRQPYLTRRVRVTFEATEVPALGLASYALVRKKDSMPASPTSLITADHVMENEYLVVAIADNGSLTISHKATGRIYRGIGVYEDTGDIGNEYMYRQPDTDVPITTRELTADIRLVENTPYRAAFEIIHQLDIPEDADEQLQREMTEMVWFTSRKSGRSRKTVPLMIRTLVSLEKSGRAVGIKTEFDNQAKQHRLRVFIPTGLQTGKHYADSIFEVVERDNRPASGWTNPSNCQHQNAFVTVASADAGITVANRGLQEYEILPDQENTIAVTLLRAVGELGDWGYFPTPGAQCIGKHTVEFSIMPHEVGETPWEASYRDAYQFGIPLLSVQTDVHPGTVGPRHSFLEWEGPHLAFSSLKASAETGDFVARWVNLAERITELSVRPDLDNCTFYRSDLLETVGEAFAADAKGTLKESVGKAKIVTYGFRRKEGSE
ncbi:alpha-mannosidase [Paenibacillus aurantius]|uniref:Alpha-mannosidase n=1 Tax=Paenibacillus aurantius TaxID=2918900 RepID=A0AA96LFI6_9BACL|nr:alpha-mannosidase [Paenibacillus aurantius]WNQ13074.1 alpha-mannosidase [Paenibacillus aurantius]